MQHMQQPDRHPADRAEHILEEIKALREDLRDLRESVRDLRTEKKDPLPRLQDLADELGVSRSTMYAKLRRHGIPVRDSNGFPKAEGDRSAAHVSRSEWESKEALHTRTVRKSANCYD
jgi:DNA-binding transcriptional MocR family regulator